ncbi:hypothetical protein [Agrobacterium sp. SORGH_AS 787]|uniref:hypothetical protein n=1 Tax=Agrobacterium sp. SORGH_AS 787 TaxID=3041775 RepID=UPI0032B81460
MAIKAITSDQNHVGLLYRDSIGVQFCHLAFHHDLRFEAARTDYYWASSKVFNEDDENEMVLAARLIALQKQGGMIAYGFCSGDKPSFSSQGEFIGFPCSGMGLTCATFVLEIFHSMGFFIADIASWENRDSDAAWKDSILSHVRLIDEEHSISAETYKTSVRIRPEEAAACVLSHEPPTRYKEAIEMAKEILADMHQDI